MVGFRGEALASSFFAKEEREFFTMACINLMLGLVPMIPAPLELSIELLRNNTHYFSKT